MKERTRQWLMRNYWLKWLPTMPLRINSDDPRLRGEKIAWDRWIELLRNSMEKGLAERMEPEAIVPKAEVWNIARRQSTKFLVERLGDGVLETLDALDNKTEVC